jgi:hypothetical protein
MNQLSLWRTFGRDLELCWDVRLESDIFHYPSAAGLEDRGLYRFEEGP